MVGLRTPIGGNRWGFVYVYGSLIGGLLGRCAGQGGLLNGYYPGVYAPATASPPPAPWATEGT